MSSLPPGSAAPFPFTPLIDIYRLGRRTVVEESVLWPQLGDL